MAIKIKKIAVKLEDDVADEFVLIVQSPHEYKFVWSISHYVQVAFVLL